MGGIRGHHPAEMLPVFLVIVIVLFLSLRNQPNGGWIGLGMAATVAVLFVVGSAAAEFKRRMRRGYLVMLRNLAAGEPTEAAVREAAELARLIVKTRTDTYSLALRDMPSFFEAAKGTTEIAHSCREVLFRHAPWTEKIERDIAAMRYQLKEDEFPGWLEWFLNAYVAWPEFSDRVADVAMYALPRIPEPERRRLLERTLVKATDRESWRHLGRVLEKDLRALDPEKLSAFQREKLSMILSA